MQTNTSARYVAHYIAWKRPFKYRAASLACILAVLIPTVLQAAITVDGDVNPVYSGSDPWELGSSVLFVGDAGTGSLEIDGGSVINDFHGDIGYESGSSGTVTVTGIGSVWNNSSHLDIGRSGAGILNIENGGTVNVSYSSIGVKEGSTGAVTVTGSDSVWNNSKFLTIGSYGTGTLNVGNGGNVSNTWGRIGTYEGSSGTVTVTGAGSVWNNYSGLDVGLSGTGYLHIEDGATVNAANGTQVSLYATGVGVIHFNNGTLNTIGLLAPSSQLLGIGTINTTGIVSDIDLVFNATSGLQQQIILNNLPGDSITINLNMIDSEYFGAIGVGYSGIGSLVIKDSMAVLSNGGYLGYQPGSSGTATVAGSGSVWNNRQSLYIGFEGTGMLSIEGGGGAVSRLGYLGHSNGSNGTVTVTGAGSTWNNSNRLSVGYYGAGTLNVENGGTVNSDQIAYLGQYEGASGNANIIGTGSAWNNTEDLYVGYSGNGSLSIKDGGLVNNLKGSLAYNIGANATVSVEGAGSVWNNSGSFAVARYGTGILNIKNGGTVNNEASSMGSAEGAIGIVTVTGSDSLWNNTGRMIIGVGGAGTLNIENGGMVSISNGMKIASSAGSSGTVNLSRGTLDMNGSNIVAGEGMVVFNFTAGVIKDATNIDLKKRFVQSGGILAPGGSIGQTDIVGDYDLTAGTLELELGGLGNPVDLVTATGDIDISILGTILDLRALGSMAAGTYTVLESTRGTITGMFESVSAFNLFGVNATVLNTGTAITVTLDSDLVFADPNTDGFVGIEDLNILLANWNQTVTPGDILAGDLNGDGFVGIEDLNAILGNWNAGAPPPPPDVSAATPEPGTISVLAISAVWGGARRRTRRL